MKKFNPGDLVVHKATINGPVMVVSWVDQDQITCSWFDGNEFRSNTFLEPVLTKHE